MLDELGGFLRIDLAAVTREAKSSAVEPARELARLSAKARREGLLALEEDREARGDEELAFFLSLVVDGCGKEAVDDLAGLRMAAEPELGRKFRLFVIRLGCLALMRGESPRMTAIYIREAFGKDKDLVGTLCEIEAMAMREAKADAPGKGEAAIIRAGDSVSRSGAGDFVAEPRVAMPFMAEWEAGYNKLSSLDSSLAKLVGGGDKDVAADALIEAKDPGRLFGLAAGDERRLELLRGLYERVSLLAPGEGSLAAREAIASVLGSISDERYASLLARARSADPELALRLEADSLRFDRITRLDDRYVQKLLREVDQACLVKALYGASEEVRDKIFKNVSPRAAALMGEDLESIGELPAAEVAKSRKAVLEAMAALARQGEIVLS